VAKVRAVPPSKRVLNASGFRDFLVIVIWVGLIAHCGPTELTNPLPEHYKTERKPEDAEGEYAEGGEDTEGLDLPQRHREHGVQNRNGR
jgi:hypothetical protein